MTNAELIKVLRCELYGDDECDNSDCPIWSELGCRNGIANRAAADALATADKRISELEEEHNKTVTAIFWEEQLWWENRCKELEAERMELIEKCRRLEAQIPKEGVWIMDEHPHDGDCRCSVCLVAIDAMHERNHGLLNALTGGKWWTFYRYCPNCGAKMRTVTDCHTLEEGER